MTLRAIGFTCGVGSMLVGARQAGFDVIGNIEWRRYYHHRDQEGRNTFEQNFPDSYFVKTLEDLTEEQLALSTGVDIALGHPECGNYSVMNQNRDRLEDPGDIPVFINLVRTLKPRFFVQDNLPGSLRGVKISEWAEALPDYDLFPEWISNYHYGNTQKNRKRFFMIGALKQEGFIFHPGEFHHQITVREALKGIEGLPNNSEHDMDAFCGKDRISLTDRKWREEGGEYMDTPTWRDFQEYFSDKPGGHVMLYVNHQNMINRRVGTSKSYADGHSHVLDGSSPIVNPLTNLPYNIRERARIQGCPDDFVFYGERLPYNHCHNTELLKQTGKWMPVEFCRFVSQQIYAHINGLPFPTTGHRLINDHELIDQAKEWYCREVGYRNQDAVCMSCWIKPCQRKLALEERLK